MKLKPLLAALTTTALILVPGVAHSAQSVATVSISEMQVLTKKCSAKDRRNWDNIVIQQFTASITGFPRDNRKLLRLVARAKSQTSSRNLINAYAKFDKVLAKNMSSRYQLNSIPAVRNVSGEIRGIIELRRC